MSSLQKLVRTNATLFILNNVNNIANYAIQILLAHLLIPAAFGIYNSFLSITVLMGTVAVIIPYLSTNHLIDRENHPEKSREQMAHLLWMILATIAVAIMFWHLEEKLLLNYLHVDSVWGARLTVAGAFTVLLAGYSNGFFQGIRRYDLFGFFNLSISLARIVAIFIFVGLLPLSFAGALLANLSGNALLVILFWSMPQWLPARDRSFVRVVPLAPSASYLKEVSSRSATVFVVSLSLALLGNMDIILVQRFFSEQIAGLYAASSVVGKVILYLSNSVLQMVYPETVAAKKSQNPYAIRMMRLYVLVASTTVMVLGGLMTYFSRDIVTLTMGNRYVAGSDVLKWLVLYMTGLGMLGFLMNYSLSFLSLRFYAVPSIVVILTIAGVHWRWHESPSQIVLALFAGTAQCIAYFIWIIWRDMHGKHG